MRLTLRTLLAYLDNTLDRDSAETLRVKIAESGFASQLMQRIKTTLALPSLGALPPEAAGPVEEANVMSEYLDSTLPGEQVAEIERACLEAEPLLAEAASCHQILTLVLGQPAEVSPALRDRIYGLPEQLSKEAAAAAASGSSFSSVVIPEEPNLGLASTTDGTVVGANLGDPSAGGSLPLNQATAKPAMSPVGPADSGVSDAPTRLRNAGLVGTADGRAATTSGGATLAGSRPRDSRLPDGFGGSIRTSRIAPWLVSLGLTAALLFALVQIFSPLLDRSRRKVAENDRIETYADVTPDPDEPLSPSSIIDATKPSTPTDTANTSEAIGNEMAQPKPKPSGDMIASGESPASADANDSAAVNPAAPTAAPDAATAPPSVSTAPPNISSEPATAPEGSVATRTPEVPAKPIERPADAADLMPPVPPIAPSPNDGNAASPTPADTMPIKKEPQPAPVVDEVPMAKLLTDSTLVVSDQGSGNWKRLKLDDPIASGTDLVCAPTFRAKLETVSGLQVTMAGPTQMRFFPDGEAVGLQLLSGNALLTGPENETSVLVSLGGQPVTIRFVDPGTVVALMMQHERAPGTDPLEESTRTHRGTLIVAQGSAELTTQATKSTLTTGQQWEFMNANPPTSSVAKTFFDWINEPDANRSSLMALARTGLLSLVNNNPSIELSLQEAIGFRRAEVGALAAQTMLWLGRGDVYFGGDGILNRPNQRAYWDDHYAALVKTLNQSADRAEELRDAIGKMEAADRDQLFELLAGYSQAQLEAGADIRLVQMLDSVSMPVRVLALQNLKLITGTSLNYRADQDNAIRRDADIKKWEVRARKGDIRWTVPEVANSEPDVQPNDNVDAPEGNKEVDAVKEVPAES